MIKLLLALAILVWPFGQLLSLIPWGSFIRLQLLDLIALLLFLSLLPLYKKVIRDPLFLPLAFFSLAAAVSLLVNPALVSFSSAGYLLRFVSYTSFYFAFRTSGVKKFSKLLLLSAIIFISLGLLQYLFLPDVRFIKFLGFDDHYYRLVGSFLDPNFTGAVLAVLTLLTFGLLRGKSRLLSFLPLIALVLTFSRASYLALAASVIYLSFVRKQLSVLISLLLIPLFLVVVPKPFGEGVNLARTFSIESRLTNQAEAFRLFSQKPTFGQGFNVFKESKTGLVPNLTSGVDNSFLFVAVTTGIVGFALFLNLLIRIFRQTENHYLRASLIALFVHSLFNNTLFYSWILALIYLLAAKRKTSP